MQWLNSIDNVLDNAFLPRSNNDSSGDEYSSSAEDDDEEYTTQSSDDGIEDEEDEEDEEEEDLRQINRQRDNFDDDDDNNSVDDEDYEAEKVEGESTTTVSRSIIERQRPLNAINKPEISEQVSTGGEDVVFSGSLPDSTSSQPSLPPIKPIETNSMLLSMKQQTTTANSGVTSPPQPPLLSESLSLQPSPLPPQQKQQQGQQHQKTPSPKLLPKQQKQQRPATSGLFEQTTTKQEQQPASHQQQSSFPTTAPAPKQRTSVANVPLPSKLRPQQQQKQQQPSPPHQRSMAPPPPPPPPPAPPPPPPPSLPPPLCLPPPPPPLPPPPQTPQRRTIPSLPQAQEQQPPPPSAALQPQQQKHRESMESCSVSNIAEEGQNLTRTHNIKNNIGSRHHSDKDSTTVSIEAMERNRTTSDSFDCATSNNSDKDKNILKTNEDILEPALPRIITRSSSLSQKRRLDTDFHVEHFLSSWNEEVTPGSFDSQMMNCYGVVHVRVLRAQRLPCSVGSAVQAVVSLKPWKGRVRTESTRTFLLSDDRVSSTMDHGVCVQWFDESEQDLASPEVSMVHAYSGEETPVPSIHVELRFISLKLFEFTMCSLNLSCDVLMRTPGNWRRQWFVATANQDNNQSKNANSTDYPALIELEAMFAAADETKNNIDPTEMTYDESERKFSMSESFYDRDEVLVHVDGNEKNPSSSFSTDTPKKNQSASLLSFDTEDNFTIASSTSPLKTVSSRPHLLRLKKFWTPAVCCVCSSVILAGWKQGFHCESCKIDCCSDCRLHADLQVPCGSELAQIARRKAIQNKLTVDNVLETVAPVDEKKKVEIEKLASLEIMDSAKKKSSVTPADSSDFDKEDVGAIGTLELDLLEACVFDSSLPAETDPSDLTGPKGNQRLRAGDYYIRVYWTGSVSSARTRTIQHSAGRFKFGSSEMRFNVSHYGVEFRIEVVDATTDKPVGTTLLATQTLLQQQRDLMVDEGCLIRLVELTKGPSKFQGTRRMKLELRKSKDGGTSSGQIVGWIDVRAGLAEHVDKLFGPEPIECPPRPPDNLNIQVLQTHLNRISTIIGEAKKVFEAYLYLVSWRSPALTGISLFFFVSFCLRFNAEYFGCLPFFFLALYMLYCALLRKLGVWKKSFLRKEADACREAEKKIGVRYKLHRPLGKMNISVLRGRNIRSRELGLPGNVSCWLYWDPLRYMKEKHKKSFIQMDSSAATIHDIGVTDSTYKINPNWNKIQESEESKRLKQLIPNHGDYFSEESVDDNNSLSWFQFPVLQPFHLPLDDAQNDGSLEPWTTSPAAIVVQVRFRDILNMLPGSDQIFGEVSVPFAHLATKGVLFGWFRIFETGTTRFVPVMTDENEKKGSSAAKDSNTDANDDDTEDVPQLFLKLNWTPPDNNEKTATDTEREASIVVQEELIRWSVIGQESKTKFVDTSIGAFNTIRGLGGILQIVQNTLGLALDLFESFRNAFNFTDPFKSTVLLIFVGLGYLVFSIIPTRFVVLLGGLAQYGVTFAKRFANKSSVIPHTTRQLLEESDTSTSSSENETTESVDGGVAVLTWIVNALRGLPTDEDLRKTYFWESRRIGVREREMYASKKRLARLQRLWKAQWHAAVKIRRDNVHNSSAGSKWEKAFAIVQGRQFLWWRSVDDFDGGEAPLGKIFFAGHAGLSNLSPLEMRELHKKEIPLVVIIFGRGTKHAQVKQCQQQERLTLLTTDVKEKDGLERAVLSALSTKED